MGGSGGKKEGVKRKGRKEGRRDGRKAIAVNLCNRCLLVYYYHNFIR